MPKLFRPTRRSIRNLPGLTKPIYMKTPTAPKRAQTTLALLTRQWLSLLCLLPVLACQGQNKNSKQDQPKKMNADQTSSLPRTEVKVPEDRAVATFANGCFWCTEAVFQDLKGVESVASGYSGGFIKNPAYREVCNGTTGHAEALQIVYDPNVVSFEKLLEVFWKTHDPTTLNRQGNDVGTQYRSGIYFTTPEQQAVAQAMIDELTQEKAFGKPIVTEVVPLDNYSAAEDYHQDFFERNPNQGYCMMVAAPKVAKFRKTFARLAK